jgi:cell fate regulator YaaT (PSP1 superfamily)
MMDNRQKEDEAFIVCLKKIRNHDLKMKLVDVEYQYDGNKICFYFTADKRIDFRRLSRILRRNTVQHRAQQIGVRDEARRLGGLGVCGGPSAARRFSIRSSRLRARWPAIRTSA